MERHFEGALRELKEKLIGMAGLVERAINTATLALKERDRTKLGHVFELEEKINQAHKSIDDSCLKLLATQQPMAVDLRLIIATIKINTDLERMGDQAVNIAHSSGHYLAAPPLKPLIDLPVMAEEVRLMVREAIDAFVRGDAALAREVLKRDDRVDGLKSKIFRDVIEHIKTAPSLIEQGLSLILIARNLERIGDHATNISEDVIFVVTGEDIRHSPRLDTVHSPRSPKTDAD